ncbi:MAG: carboxypeptidase M32 [Phycisphaerae bacterium]|nr:carboxypeptidase M32 [Phycisphaerae bacterium]
MPKPAPAAYPELCSLLREAATLNAVGSLVSWDQETYMPPAAAAARAEQSSLLARLVHERRTNPRVGELIGACENDASLNGDGAVARSLREMRRDYDLATKLPGSLVAELAKVGSQAQEVWKKARADSDFAAFAPWLERMMALSRRKAECYGWPREGEIYDALLDEYEPGMTSRQVGAIFTPLRTRLTDLLGRLMASRNKPGDAPLKAKIPQEAQHRFGLTVLKALGFDLDAGRLDVTTHPFCSGLAPGDTRLTTRYRDEKFTDALFGTMHEMGHGLYEQGLPKTPEHFGTPLADAISLGIHESQSRMWENFVGRGKPFWRWALPHARKAFGRPFATMTLDRIYRAVNIVTPSLIRVEADECTYNLHIMVRFELERALLSGGLKVKDLPGEWNRRYKEYLHIKIPDDRRGCLQDVHWSFGLVGYFPTYTLGNLYAGQFWEKIRRDLKDLDTDLARGRFDGLKGWLNRHIHAHGKRYRAGELCERVTGRPLSADPLLRHLETKLGEVYGL